MMKVRIEDKSGLTASKTYSFDDKKKRISIGRRTDCDICFPADLTEISRHHLDLVWKVSRLRIEKQADNPVYVNSKEAFDGDELPKKATLTLGKKGGPQLTVDVKEVSNLADTDPDYKAQPSAGAMAFAATAKALKNRNFIVGFIFVAVIGGYFLFTQLAKQQEAIVSFEENLKTAVSNSPKALQKQLLEATNSVYMVVIKNDGREEPLGTAWVVDNGILATNAHVASEIAKAKDSGREIIVRSNFSPPADVEIIDFLVHPGWIEYQKWFDSNLPAGSYGQIIDKFPAYDVALLFTDEINTLTQPLPLASKDELNMIKQGDSIGLVSYAVEYALLAENMTVSPVPQIQTGEVISITDVFGLRSNEFIHQQVIHHNVLGSGGSSGSPIINSSGKVIAIHNAGSPSEFGRGVMSPSGINFGIRSDLIAQLIKNSYDETMQFHRQFWEKRKETFPPIELYNVAKWAGNFGLLPEEVPKIYHSEGTFAWESNDSSAFYHRFVLTFHQEGNYLLRANTDIVERNGQKALVPVYLEIFLREENEGKPIGHAGDFFPAVPITTKPGDEIIVVLSVNREHGKKRYYFDIFEAPPK